MLPRAILAIAMLATLTAGLVDRSAASDDVLRVFVGIPPQQYLVDRIGGVHVTTEVLVAPGQSPHSFDATPRQMVALAESRAYFAIGLEFERELITKVRELNPDLTIVDMGRGVPRRPIEGDEEDPASRDTGSEPDASEHGGSANGREHGRAAGGLTDPHIWLAPCLLAIEAENAAEALVALDPTHAADYRANLDALLADLNDLDRELAGALAPVRGKTVYVFHPAFGYFTDAYSLKQVAVETGGSEPGARDLARLVEEGRRDGVRVIFVQPEFATKSAEAVAREIGGAVVPIDPLAYDVVANLRTVARRIRAALIPEDR
jgi:zinc transport system substrate-binding protein